MFGEALAPPIPQIATPRADRLPRVVAVLTHGDVTFRLRRQYPNIRRSRDHVQVLVLIAAVKTKPEPEAITQNAVNRLIGIDRTVPFIINHVAGTNGGGCWWHKNDIGRATA